MPRNFTNPRRRMEARRHIEEMIRRDRLWGERLAGDRELAALMGISRGTVQTALAEMESEGLIVRRQGSGTYVTDRPKGNGRKRNGPARLAVITPEHHEEDSGWSYRAEMIRGVLGCGRRLGAGCEVLALDRPEERERVWDARAMRDFAGFITVSISDRAMLSHLLGLRRGPVVVVDRGIRDLPVTVITDGSFEGARTVTRHLLGLGHRRIGFIAAPDPQLINPDKFDGYRAALAEKDLEPDEDLVAWPAAPQPAEKFIDAAVERFLSLSAPPTAIFASNDDRALPAMRALERRGLRVGQDISLAGFGDTAFRRGLCDRLTSCRIHVRTFGREAARAALQRARSSEARTIIVPDRLYTRASTCPPARRS